MSSKEVASLRFIKQSPEVIHAWLPQVLKDLSLLCSSSGVHTDTCILLVFMTNRASEEQWRCIGKALQTLWGRSPWGGWPSTVDWLPQVIPWGKEPWDSLSGMLGAEHTGHQPYHRCRSGGWLSGWTHRPTWSRWGRNSLDMHTGPAWPASTTRPWTSLLCVSCLSFHLEISKLSSVSNISGSAIWGTSTRLVLRYYKFVIPQFRGPRSYFPCYKQSLSN